MLLIMVAGANMEQKELPQPLPKEDKKLGEVVPNSRVDLYLKVTHPPIVSANVGCRQHTTIVHQHDPDVPTGPIMSERPLALKSHTAVSLKGRTIIPRPLIFSSQILIAWHYIMHALDNETEFCQGHSHSMSILGDLQGKFVLGVDSLLGCVPF